MIIINDYYVNIQPKVDNNVIVVKRKRATSTQLLPGVVCHSSRF